ncbi:hypothetical protein DFH11DRAFT_1770652 [Phellopilus nigrolimitatus]|nr:hypothetical protein DFH11DRAFT_1770652 [Phellopilus nigrolimitatus]
MPAKDWLLEPGRDVAFSDREALGPPRCRGAKTGIHIAAHPPPSAPGRGLEEPTGIRPSDWLRVLRRVARTADSGLRTLLLVGPIGWRVALRLPAWVEPGERGGVPMRRRGGRGSHRPDGPLQHSAQPTRRLAIGFAFDGRRRVWLRLTQGGETKPNIRTYVVVSGFLTELDVLWATFVNILGPGILKNKSKFVKKPPMLSSCAVQFEKYITKERRSNKNSSARRYLSFFSSRLFVTQQRAKRKRKWKWLQGPPTALGDRRSGRRGGARASSTAKKIATPPHPPHWKLTSSSAFAARREAPGARMGERTLPKRCSIRRARARELISRSHDATPVPLLSISISRADTRDGLRTTRLSNGRTDRTQIAEENGRELNGLYSSGVMQASQQAPRAPCRASVQTPSDAITPEFAPKQLHGAFGLIGKCPHAPLVLAAAREESGAAPRRQPPDCQVVHSLSQPGSSVRRKETAISSLISSSEHEASASYISAGGRDTSQALGRYLK